MVADSLAHGGTCTQYSLTDEPEVLPFEPRVTINYHDAVTRFQPTYFEVESIESAKRIFLYVACRAGCSRM